MLYQFTDTRTTYQNMFRGIPAISRLDWPFTPYHNSSKPIATGTGSVLNDLVMVRSPGFGSNHGTYPFNVVAFAKYFYLHHRLTRWPIMQKVRSYLVFKLRFLLLIELPVQDLFTSYLLTFQLSLTVLFTIAQYIIFSLRGWFPYIQTSYLSSYLLLF